MSLNLLQKTTSCILLANLDRNSYCEVFQQPEATEIERRILWIVNQCFIVRKYIFVMMKR